MYSQKTSWSDKPEYGAAPSSGEIYFIDDGEEEASDKKFDTLSADFSEALRLLLFSDRIIQPFEKKLVIDVLLLGVESASEDEKLSVAQALPKTGRISQPLADRLLLTGSNSIKIMLLENYAYHSEEALKSVAEEACSEVLSSLAERKNLAKNIVHALLGRENIEITRLVLQNDTADRDVSVIETLFETRLSDEEALLSLLNTPDMEPSLALKLFWNAPASVRQIILKRFLKSHLLVDRYITQRTIANPSNLPLAMWHVDPHLNATSIAKGLQEAIDSFKLEQRDNAFNLMTLCLALPQHLLRKIMSDKSGEAFVVLLKALGLEREQSRKFVKDLSQSTLAKEWSDLTALYEVCDIIGWNEARMALTYWFWQIEAIGPYQAPVEDFFLENISSTEGAEFSEPEVFFVE